jgi:predicted dehydrogenase
MDEKATIAVIGAGWWATQTHIPALQANPRARIVLVDHNPQALSRAAAAYHIEHAYTSLADALHAHSDIRGAVVAVPHSAHYAAAREALENNLHLLLEKPMTLYARDARALVELAARRNRQILMGYTFPYVPPLLEAKKRMDEGLIGDIEYITCSMSSMTIEFLRGRPHEYSGLFNYPVTGPTEETYSRPETAGGGQAHLQITHSASLMFHLAPGLRAQTVCAFMNNLDCQVDVADAFAVRMENGAVATVGSTGNIGKGDRGLVEVHLHGSRGRLLADAISGHVYIRLHDGREERFEPSYPAYPGAEPSKRFIEIILDGADNYLPGDPNGWYTVELLDAAYRSAAQEGMPVQVASLYD